MRRIESDNRVFQMVMTAMMMCLIMVATWTFKLPVPINAGYVHLGDAMIFLAVLLLGTRSGAIAAGMGSGLADLLAGYAHWAPWTFAIKFLMALVTGLLVERLDRKKGERASSKGIIALEILGMAAGAAVMVIGYLLAGSVVYGSFGAALISFPPNIAQGVVGIALSCILATALEKTPIGKYFAIRIG